MMPTFGDSVGAALRSIAEALRNINNESTIIVPAWALGNDTITVTTADDWSPQNSKAVWTRKE